MLVPGGPVCLLKLSVPQILYSVRISIKVDNKVLASHMSIYYMTCLYSALDIEIRNELFPCT